MPDLSSPLTRVAVVLLWSFASVAIAQDTRPAAPAPSPPAASEPAQAAAPPAAAKAQPAAPAEPAPAAPPAKTEPPAPAQPTPPRADASVPAPPAEGAPTPASTEAEGAQDVAALLASMDDDSAVNDVLAQDTLSVYGFADFTFEKLWATGPTAALYPNAPFMVGHLNVYLDARLHEQWRSLAEVRFTYLPHGSLDVQTGQVVSTTALDYTDGLARIELGGLEIERVWLDYSPTPWLSIRGGQWLTPYGIWNVDHGSPTLIGIQKPYLTGVQMFPERQTGLAARATFPLNDEVDLTLHATLSNGRGGVDEYRDLDGNKAMGGRAELRHLGDARIQLGTSFYRGRFTDSEAAAEIGSDEITITLEPISSYDELAIAGDLRVEWNGISFLSEAVMNEIAFVDGLRPGGVGGLLSSPQADMRRWSAYALLGYQIESLLLMPYVSYDYIEDALTTGEYNLYRGGLRFTPIASVTIKGEYTHAVALRSLTTDDTVRSLRFQAAWAFQ